MLLPALYTTHAVTKWPGLEPMTDWEVFQEQNVWQNNQYAEGMNKKFSGFSARNSRVSAFDRFMEKNMVLLVHSHFINGAGSLGEKQLGIGACLPVWLFGIWLQCLAAPCIEVSVRTINFGSFGQG